MITRISGRHLPTILLLAIVLSLQSCALLGGGDEKKTATLVNYEDPEQRDHWQENLKRWYAWDSSWPQNQTTELSYEENAITVNIEADKRLNLYDGRSHTVIVKIIQLSNAAVINEMTQTSEGLATLLSNAELSANVVAVKELVIAPSEIISITLPREQNTKFLATLVGFSSLDPSRSHKLIPVPLVKIPPPEEAQYLTDIIAEKIGGLFGNSEEQEDKNTYRQARLKLDIELGNQQINAMQVAAF